MVCTCNNECLQQVLKWFAVISGVLSLSGILIWGKSCYDVLVVSNIRQDIRLLILKKVDEEIEHILDEHVPGPSGNRGSVGIIEPRDVEVFQKPILFIIVGAAFIVGHLIHCILAIWLFVVAKTGSFRGVRTWFIVTLILVIVSLTGIIIHLSQASFHILSFTISTFFIIFYIIGLIFAFKFKPRLDETQRERKHKKFSLAGTVLIELGALLT